ncbi:hypothetical protein FRACA_2790008 [Frankia canadensis]|uniref:Uncharacterized protein n=1 Tax=Frankia canadensis TaxID=1836972 RepID=A0A2I2KT13_9ACTN|nr:hypothetical protein FRACA_2790008 [Frankia canadensis]SOU56069.1 hypothetical protein FRACA_2790008 [Frankia canadensis]
MRAHGTSAAPNGPTGGIQPSRGHHGGIAASQARSAVGLTVTEVAAPDACLALTRHRI